MSDFVMTVRAVEDREFAPEVGETQFLIVPDSKDPSPENATTPALWFKAVRKASVWRNADKEDRGDILFIVHGYNMSETEVMACHRRLKEDLTAEGFKGVVVSFDWPSDNKTLAYLPDRHRAKLTALQLVTDGIAQLSKDQTPDCTINVHVLGHSTGAFVIREAFDDADDTGLPNSAWGVSQIVFAAGDVSASSMSADDSSTESIYRHCVRLTNFSNRHDEALDISNVKRLGTAPRVGRIGLPDDAPSKAVNIDCTSYYEELTREESPITAIDQPNGFMGMKSHSWYFGNKMFTKDLFCVLIGKDRTVIPSRDNEQNGKVNLKHIG